VVLAGAPGTRGHDLAGSYRVVTTHQRLEFSRIAPVPPGGARSPHLSARTGAGPCPNL